MMKSVKCDWRMTNSKVYKSLNTGTGDLEMNSWATKLYKGREIIVSLCLIECFTP